MNNYNYKWELSKYSFAKNKGSVFSCFSCGGGSTMGYKLSGFDVLGCCEIDKRMCELYDINHKPNFIFNEDIRIFKNKKLPHELYNLDILDGSPPCSSFSMCGEREKGWGKKKKFAEGQISQILDTLFFDFIELGGKLQPKIIIAENVVGITLGNAKKYMINIYKQFDQIGYFLNHYKLNSKSMGVPQSRERIFFIALRKDLSKKFMDNEKLFDNCPKLNFNFNLKEIPYNEIEEKNVNYKILCKSSQKMWEENNFLNKNFIRHTGHTAIGYYKIDPSKPLHTIMSGSATAFHPYIPRGLSALELCLASTFPIDYNFLKYNTKYVVGMSVPPVMMAHIADVIFDQWIRNF